MVGTRRLMRYQAVGSSRLRDATYCRAVTGDYEKALRPAGQGQSADGLSNPFVHVWRHATKLDYREVSHTLGLAGLSINIRERWGIHGHLLIHL